jgi:hypothetical protein
VIARDQLRCESRVSASPIWLRLVDTFTGLAPVGPLNVHVEKKQGGTWIPLAVPYQVSSSGDLGFLDLGKGRPGQTGTFDVRVFVTNRSTVAVTDAGDPFVTATVSMWTADVPPTPTPQSVRFLPAPDYNFGPGVPLLSGRVVDSGGDPVDRERVSATEIVRSSPVVEEAMTTVDGWFRLPLRWSSGPTQIDAVCGSLTGTKTITLPGDLSTTVTLTVT